MDFSHCCITWDAANSLSHITYKTVYRGSTYMWIDLYARTYGI